MSAVADASVVLKLVFPEIYSERAAALFAEVQGRGERIVAPAVLSAEMTNVIRRRMRRERLALSVAMAALDTYFSFAIPLIGEPELSRQALRLTDAYSLGGHDAHYVALAQTLGCDLWTDDQRVLRAIGGRLPFVKWIGDYAPPTPEAEPV